jgi:hypothetical protein
MLQPESFPPSDFLTFPAPIFDRGAVLASIDPAATTASQLGPRLGKYGLAFAGLLLSWWYVWTSEVRSIRERKRWHQADYIFSSCGNPLLAKPARTANLFSADAGAGDQRGR